MFGVFRLIWELFTHLETSPLPVKDYSLWSIPDTQLWPLNREDSLMCHTCCDTDQSFIMVICNDLWHSHLAERLAVERSLLVLTSLSRPGIELRFPACEANALPLRQCGGLFYKKTKLMNYMFVKYWFASMLQIRLVMIQNAFFIKDKKRSYNCCCVHSRYIQDFNPAPGIGLHKI